jgi:hypothetical protein
MIDDRAVHADPDRPDPTRVSAAAAAATPAGTAIV